MIWFGWVLWDINHCRLFNAKSFLYKSIEYIWFGLVGFYGISTSVVYLMPNPLYTYTHTHIYIYIYIYIYMIWFGWVLWHINQCRLFNAKSFLYISIIYMWFGLVGFYGISNIVDYLISDPFYTYIYIKYIWFGLVGFYGISTIVGYLMPNPFYTYPLNIYDLAWLDFMAYQTL